MADTVRRSSLGDQVQVRGLIKFSNRCICNCQYCDLHRANTHLHRYIMPRETIMTAAAGADTFVLQSGEDPEQPASLLAGHIQTIKTSYPHMSVTLSVGERPRADYALWRQAGRIAFSSGQDTCPTPACITDLAELGYTVGSGFIRCARTVPGRYRGRHYVCATAECGHMLGWPFIPQSDTPFCNQPAVLPSP